MPYSLGDLRREVLEIVRADLEVGNTVRRSWLTHAVLSRHVLPPMPDRDFNMLCRMDSVARAVRDVLRDLKLAADDPDSVSSSGAMPLPGFKHLQIGYPLHRDGESVIVPLSRMTSSERRDRADRYDTMAVGCTEHAAELRRYDDRVGGVA